jgi:hypothetical protein
MLERSCLRAPSFLCVALAAAVLPVPLSTSQAQSQPPAHSNPSQNIPDQKLDKAAAVLRQISSIKLSYQQQLNEAPTPPRRTLLRKPMIRSRRRSPKRGFLHTSTTQLSRSRKTIPMFDKSSCGASIRSTSYHHDPLVDGS